MPAVHRCDDGCCKDLPLAVHWVQVLQCLWHIWEWRPASVLWWLWQRIPHVLPQPSHVRPSRRKLELSPVSGSSEGQGFHLSEPESCNGVTTWTVYLECANLTSMQKCIQTVLRFSQNDGEAGREIIGPNVTSFFFLCFTLTVTHITGSVWNKAYTEVSEFEMGNIRTLHALCAVFPHSLTLGPMFQMIEHLFMHCQIFFFNRSLSICLHGEKHGLFFKCYGSNY